MLLIVISSVQMNTPDRTRQRIDFITSQISILTSKSWSVWDYERANSAYQIVDAGRASWPEARIAIPVLIETLESHSRFAQKYPKQACTSDSKNGIRYQSAVALGKLKAKEAVPVLIDVLENDPALHVKMVAATALGEIGQSSKKALPVLRKASTSTSLLAYNARQAIGEIEVAE